MQASNIDVFTQEALDQAIARARQEQQKTTIEHALRCLVELPSFAPLWAALGVNACALAGELDDFIQPLALAPTAPAGYGALTSGLDRVIRRAVARNQLTGAPVVPLDLLMSIANEKEAEATRYLARHGATLERLIAWQTGAPLPPAPGAGPAAQPTARPAGGRVFISYAHEDADYLNRLLVHLKPLERAKRIESWSDRRISAGNKWRDEIARNLQGASIAILLVSADFLASDFILNDELPPLLMAADKRGVRILPVVLKACSFLRNDKLNIFQAVHDPTVPLIDVSHGEQERIYDRIAEAIEEELKKRSI